MLGLSPVLDITHCPVFYSLCPRSPETDLISRLRQMYYFVDIYCNVLHFFTDLVRENMDQVYI
jgi:hypothetical protein